jgi:hypothetical protein
MNRRTRLQPERSKISRRLVAGSMSVALLAAVSAPSDAQRKASEIGSVSQTVDGTVMTMEYYRPVARGRDSLFGKVVRWGTTWTPGANWATTFEADKDIQVNGNPLPKGKYAIWMIPRESEDWTVIFHRKARAFHVDRPRGTEEEQLRFTVKAEQGPHMETLTWYFPIVGPDGATLRMHWGTTFVPLQISVRPTIVAAHLDPSERAMYFGSYTFEADWAKGAQLEVSDSSGRIIASVTSPTMTDGPRFDLVPLGEHRFRTGYAMGGHVVDLSGSSTVVFTVEGGKVRSFEMLDGNGKVEARGMRTP